MDAVIERYSQQPERAGAMPLQPPGCPPLSRIYQGILREDWTADELAFFSTNPAGQVLLVKVSREVWFPSSLNLGRFALGLEVSAKERRDIEHHLRVDRCARSLRLAQAIQHDPGLAHLKKRCQEGVRPASKWLEQSLAQLISLANGPLDLRDPSNDKAVFTDEQTEVHISPVMRTREAILRLESRQPPGTPVWLTVTATDGNPRQRGIVMLQPGRERHPSTGTMRLADSALKFDLVCRLLLVQELTARDKTQLRTVVHNDSSTRSLWKSWAQRQRRAEGLDPAVSRVLEEIFLV